jgi:hypothetical protein
VIRRLFREAISIKIPKKLADLQLTKILLTFKSENIPEKEEFSCAACQQTDKLIVGPMIKISSETNGIL